MIYDRGFIVFILLLIMNRNRKIRQKIIRFRKRGKIHYPLYDIVVTYRDNRNRGSFIEKLGFFNPNSYDKLLFLNTFRLGYWVSKGAGINNNVKKYISKFLLI